MRTPIRATLLTGAAAALAIGLGATVAAASTIEATWTVTPGGSITGTAGTTTLKDTKSGTVLTCKSSAASGILKSGSGLSGTGIGSVTQLSITGRTGPLGLAFTVAAEHLPYALNARTYTASTGTTKGTITGIEAKFSASGCSLNVDGTTATTPGSVTAKFVNSSDTLSTSGGTLHIWNVSGCFGLVANGDPATLAAKYKISPAQMITSP